MCFFKIEWTGKHPYHLLSIRIFRSYYNLHSCQWLCFDSMPQPSWRTLLLVRIFTSINIYHCAIQTFHQCDCIFHLDLSIWLCQKLDFFLLHCWIGYGMVYNIFFDLLLHLGCFPGLFCTFATQLFGFEHYWILVNDGNDLAKVLLKKEK